MAQTLSELKARLAGFIGAGRQYVPLACGGAIVWHGLFCVVLWQRDGLGVLDALREGASPHWEYFPISATFALGYTGLILLCSHLGYEWRMSRLKRHFQRAISERENLSTLDGLTGFLNFRGFLEQGCREVARALRRKNVTIGVIVADVDGFRAFNARYGATAGDRVIETLARHMRESFRMEDIYCRLTKDRFLILFTDVDQNILRQIAERLRVRCQAELMNLPDGEQTGFTVSVGGAILPDYCIENRNGIEARLRELVGMGETALQMAKSAGRNCYHFFQE